MPLLLMRARGYAPAVANPTDRRAMFAATIAILSVLFAGTRAATAQTEDPNATLSRQFTQSATAALVSIHQTKDNLTTVVSKNLPAGYYNPSLGAQAYQQVRAAQLNATTAGDQQAATLLDSYFMKVKTWAEKHKAARQSMNATNTIGENAMSQDPDWQAIDSCEKGLDAMLVSGLYHIVPSCH